MRCDLPVFGLPLLKEEPPPPPPSVSVQKKLHFNGDLSTHLCLRIETLAGGLVDDGCTRRSCRRHIQWPAGEESDDSARGPNTSGCRSQWPWLRSSTTPRTVLSCRRRRRWSSTTSHGDRSQPGQGLGVPEPVREPQLQARVQRHYMEDFGNVCPSCRYSILLCRGWWTECWSSFVSWTCRLPSRLSKYPRCPRRPSRTVLHDPQMAEQLVEVPTVLSYALLQRHGGRRSLQWLVAAFCGTERRHSSSCSW